MIGEETKEGRSRVTHCTKTQVRGTPRRGKGSNGSWEEGLSIRRNQFLLYGGNLKKGGRSHIDLLRRFVNFADIYLDIPKGGECQLGEVSR